MSCLESEALKGQLYLSPYFTIRRYYALRFMNSVPAMTCERVRSRRTCEWRPDSSVPLLD